MSQEENISPEVSATASIVSDTIVPYYEVQFIIINDFGTFEGIKFIVSQPEYDNIVNISKKFFLGSGFELYTNDIFMVFPPDVVQKSILQVKKRILDDEETKDYLDSENE